MKTPEEAAAIRRIVHNAENIYGLLVSLDDKAALIRANFIEGRLDYQRIFNEVNENVVNPYQRRQHRRSTSPASRGCTAGSTTTRATSSSSSW